MAEFGGAGRNSLRVPTSPRRLKLREASSDKLALGVRRFPLTAMSAMSAFPGE
jgi:hypothetical protein